MTDTKFTKGRWACGRCRAWNPPGVMVCRACDMRPVNIVDLINAAPDLYEALDAAERLFDAGPAMSTVADLVRTEEKIAKVVAKCRAALSKARGEGR